MKITNPRNEEIRIRVTPQEKEIIINFQKQNNWKSHREMLQKLMEYYTNGHITGRFIGDS